MTVADELLQHARGHALIADTGYDSNDLVHELQKRGMQAVICNNPRRKHQRRHLDPELYRQRYLVEVCFQRVRCQSPAFGNVVPKER